MTIASEENKPENIKKYRVGIPRALYFYKFFPFWEEMLKRMNCELVVSPETNKKILQAGSNFASGELCIPVKIFFGHIMYFIDHPELNLDYIFIPRYVSLNAKHFFCPKFMALPDTVKNTIKPNIPILEWEMNAKVRSNIESAIELGEKLGLDQQEAGTAYVHAINRFNAFKKILANTGILYPDLIFKNYPQYFPKKKKSKRKVKSEEIDVDEKYPITLLILGHPYNSYEPIINQDLMERFKRYHVTVKTLENMPKQIFNKDVIINRRFKNYWNMEEELLQVARHYLIKARDEIDGVVFLISFACGPDSLIQELIMRDFQKVGTPFLDLFLDEHTGESGMVTRIESFIDMIRRKKYKTAYEG